MVRIIEHRCRAMWKAVAEMSEQFAINLLGRFGVYRDDQPLDLPPSCRRLVALAALKRRAVPRTWMCRVLWPTTRCVRAKRVVHYACVSL